VFSVGDLSIARACLIERSTSFANPGRDTRPCGQRHAKPASGQALRPIQFRQDPHQILTQYFSFFAEGSSCGPASTNKIPVWSGYRCGKPLGNEPVVVKLDRSKSVLAAEFGTTNETLSRTFAERRNQKLIFVIGRTITVPKPCELEELCKGSVG
jgi:hypothetical protein